MIPKHSIWMSTREVRERYVSHAKRRTTTKLAQEVADNSDAEPPTFAHEWREVCKAELESRACKGDVGAYMSLAVLKVQ